MKTATAIFAVLMLGTGVAAAESSNKAETEFHTPKKNVEVVEERSVKSVVDSTNVKSDTEHGVSLTNDNEAGVKTQNFTGRNADDEAEKSTEAKDVPIDTTDRVEADQEPETVTK